MATLNHKPVDDLKFAKITNHFKDHPFNSFKYYVDHFTFFTV